MVSRSSREERVRVILDAADRLFYPRGVHEVGMDELVTTTGLGKATVYRLFPTKDALIGAWLDRRAEGILALVDRDVAARPDDPAGAVRAIVRAVADDVAREGFRGCAFNNASVEFADPRHPARAVARAYRAALLERFMLLARRIDEAGAAVLAAGLALVVDGMYTSAAHLGADGPATHGPGLVELLLARHGAAPAAGPRP